MGMDLNLIKQKMAAAESNQREKVDRSGLFWNPSIGTHQIRIVPSVYNPSMPFTELFFHYNIGKYPMIALSNFGEQDPIVEFVTELKKTSDKENWSTAGKLSPKLRVFAPVIVRGEEDKGVRLWGFGKQIQKTLFSLAVDEEVGDFTDIVNGRDFTLEKVAGNPYPETTLRPRMKETPLSENPALVELWTKTQPKPIESFSKYDYDFIKKQLENWLNPDQAQESSSVNEQSANGGSNSSTNGVGVSPSAPAKDFSLEKQSSGVTKSEKTMTEFDDLFGNKSTDGADDLPF